jgi:hypothetical protein
MTSDAFLRALITPDYEHIPFRCFGCSRLRAHPAHTPLTPLHARKLDPPRYRHPLNRPSPATRAPGMAAPGGGSGAPSSELQAWAAQTLGVGAAGALLGAMRAYTRAAPVPLMTLSYAVNATVVGGAFIGALVTGHWWCRAWGGPDSPAASPRTRRCVLAR